MTPAVFAAYEKRMAVAQRRHYNDTQTQFMWFKGRTTKQIAKALNATPRTVNRWIKGLGLRE